MSRAAMLNSQVGVYRLTDFLGEGGMGQVYRGIHSAIGRVVAIKVLNASLADQSFVERFRNEARIQASLQHPNIAMLYDFLDHGGQPCIVMEYIEGHTLTQRIRECQAIPVKEALRIFQSVAEALEYVHSQGVIHRDIKSNNIKITPTGQVKVLDFGIAKSGSSPSLTMTGGFVGTLQYLSPEQFKGERANVRTDIWALGVLLYEMVTGHMPFEAETVGSLLEKISKCSYAQPSALNASIPRDVQSVICRCLKKSPSDRYGSASELLLDVKRCASEIESGVAERRSIFSMPSTLRRQQPAPPREPYGPAASWPSASTSSSVVVSSAPKRKWPVLAAAAAGILVLLFVGWYFLFGNSTNTGAGGAGAVLITISETHVGKADIWKDGRKIDTTPYTFRASPNDAVNLTLKRDGYEDYPVSFTVGQKDKEYRYTMIEKK